MIRYELGPARAQQQLGTQPFHRFTFDDGTVWTEFHRSTDGYLLRFPDLADFEVSADGTHRDRLPEKQAEHHDGSDSADHMNPLPLMLSMISDICFVSLIVFLF